ncbi:MAG: hypothetical protein Q8N28_00250 [bacterium]|nr:hypothetical protein [bacterium]
MYFWKINKLKEDLLKHPLSESELFKYLLATTIMYSLAMIPFLENNLWDVYSAIVMGMITVFGTIYIYRCNNGDKGNNFLQKYLSIGWVISIRWIVLIMLPAMIVYFIALAIYSGLPESTTLSDVIFFNLLFMSYFRLFGKHIKDVAK